jgi:hypothetical protein
VDTIGGAIAMVDVYNRYMGVDLPYENLVPDLAASSQLFQTTRQLGIYQLIKTSRVSNHDSFRSMKNQWGRHDISIWSGRGLTTFKGNIMVPKLLTDQLESFLLDTLIIGSGDNMYINSFRQGEDGSVDSSNPS